MTQPSDDYDAVDGTGGVTDVDEYDGGQDDAGVTAGEPVTEPATQVFLVQPPPPSTGEPRVDEAVTRLASLDDLPVTEHVAVFDETHRMLQDALADLDEG